jgi:hypothetical protein
MSGLVHHALQDTCGAALNQRYQLLHTCLAPINSRTLMCKCMPPFI